MNAHCCDPPVRSLGRVLIVEDDPLLRRVIVRLLRPCCDQIVEAVDGPSALDQLGADQPPDVMLLDIMLPGFSGIDVLRRFGTRGDRPRVVACTAALDSQVERELRDMGVCQFLPKPFSAEALLSALAPPT